MHQSVFQSRKIPVSGRRQSRTLGLRKTARIQDCGIAIRRHGRFHVEIFRIRPTSERPRNLSASVRTRAPHSVDNRTGDGIVECCRIWFIRRAEYRLIGTSRMRSASTAIRSLISSAAFFVVAAAVTESTPGKYKYRVAPKSEPLSRIISKRKQTFRL